MKTAQDLVREFHEKVGANISALPNMTTPEEREFRIMLIREELKEYEDATSIVEVYDGLIDLLYVVLGSFVSHGLDAEAGFHEVHRSNMTKTSARIKIGEKVQKGPDYSPPDLASIIGKVIP